MKLSNPFKEIAAKVNFSPRIILICKSAFRALQKSLKNNRSTNYQKTLSKKEAGEIIAAAWNNQDISLLAPYLDENFDYNAVDGLGAKTGKNLYLEFMSKKFNSWKKHGIIYQAKVSENNSESCVICQTEETGDIPIIIEFEVKNGLIKKMLIRTETMFGLSDLDIPERHAIIERNIVKNIHIYVDDLVESLGYESYDLEWLQAYPINNAPSFQHLCFRLGKAVFSLKILVYQASHECIEEPVIAANLPNIDEYNQLRVCEQNNLIPCYVTIDTNCLYEPRIWDAITDEQIDFKALESTADSTMSETETWTLVEQTVLTYLQSPGVDSISYTHILEFCPQIYFKKDGVRHFVYIYTHPSGVDEIPPINKSVIDQFVGWKGYYANISIFNLFGNDGFTFKTKDLYRTAWFAHNFTGLMPIEEAIEKYGTTEKNAVVYICSSF